MVHLTRFLLQQVFGVFEGVDSRIKRSATFISVSNILNTPNPEILSCNELNKNINRLIDDERGLLENELKDYEFREGGIKFLF